MGRDKANSAQFFKNYAFISYSRRDESEVAWLHKAIEEVRIPAGLPPPSDGSKHPRHLRPLFRDQTDLEVQPRSFVEQIERELAASRFLIVVCSPNAARIRPDGKHYVDWEVRRFIQAHGETYAREHILPVILAGDPGCGDPDRECLPPALRGFGPAFLEHNFPLLRLPKDRRGRAEVRKQCLIGIVSFLLGVERATIEDRHLRAERERQRKVVATTVVVTLAIVALFAWAFLGWRRAEMQSGHAREAWKEAMVAKAEQTRLTEAVRQKEAAAQRADRERQLTVERTAAELRARAEREKIEAERRAASRGGLRIESNASTMRWEILSAPDGPRPGFPPHPKSGTGASLLGGLPIGEYLVEFARSGWKPVRLKAAVAADQITTARHDYVSGGLSISSNASSVTWKIVSAPGPFDSPRRGTVPQVLSDLPVGDYLIEFYQAATPLVQTKVTLEDGRTSSARFEVPLGSLEISSNEPEVRWEIISAPDVMDQYNRLGRVPAVISNLFVGDYLIEFQCPGWPSIRRSVRVNEGSVSAVLGKFIGGAVTIDSAPSGANVLDARGSMLGRTPLTLPNVKPGDFMARLTKRGYDECIVSGLVAQDKTLNINGILQRSDVLNQSEIFLPP